MNYFYISYVVPALASCLPIKEDERENETTTKCFVNLYANKPEMVSCDRICTAQKMKFSITDFFIKCDRIRSFLRIWSMY